MTKTVRADGDRRVTHPTLLILPVRISLPPSAADDDHRPPLTEPVVDADTSTMPIHDPATLEKFRQTATACRSSRGEQRVKSLSISGAVVAAATGNGGVGRCVGAHESSSLVPLSPPPFRRQLTSPTTAETQFSQRPAEKYADADEEISDEWERLRRGRGRRRTMSVVTTARWLQQLLPSKAVSHAPTSKSNELPPPSSDDESATSDAETNLLRQESDRQNAASWDLRESCLMVDDDCSQRYSGNTFCSSTTTDQFRLSTGSDSVSVRRPLSLSDDRYSPEVFHRTGTNSDVSEPCTVTDHDARRRVSSDTDAFQITVTSTNNDASTADNDDVDRVSATACIDPSLLVPNTCPLLRYTLLICSILSHYSRQRLCVSLICIFVY